jgi:ribosome-associated translation inhibitor RaiA
MKPPTMQVTPSISYRGMRRPEPLDAEIVERIERLGRFTRSIVGCRVLVELRERHQEGGSRYRVRVDLAVPGETIVATRASNHHAAVAVREAFDAVRRQLQDLVHRQRSPMASRRRAARAAARVRAAG